MQRVTVAGSIPVGVDGRPSEAKEGDATYYSPVVVHALLDQSAVAG